MTDPQTVRAMAIRQSLGVEKLGDIMYKSGFFSDARSQAQAIVKILAGAELDFGPIAAMNGVYIINGKTSLAAVLVGAAIQRSDRYRYRIVEQTNDNCTIDFFEIVDGKREKIGTSSFSMKDAEQAELSKTANYKKFPRNMLFSRALTNGARWFCPDVFNGPVYTPDELGAEVNEEGQPINIQPYVPTDEREVDDQPRPEPANPNRMVTSADDRVWQRWLEIRDEGLKYGVPFADLQLPIGYKQLVSHGTMLAAQIQDKKSQLALEDSQRAEGSGWERNRALSAEAYAMGIRLKDLANTATPAEVAERNHELEQLIAEHNTKTQAF
jgi:hypothetical protein